MPMQKKLLEILVGLKYEFEMKKLFLFTIVVCSAFFLSACQIYKNFVVRNASDSEITLEYTLREAFLRQGDIVKPKVESTENFLWFPQRKWIPMSDARYNFDNGGRKFTLKINPKEAVIIESKDSYYIDRDGEKAIDLIDLRIKDNGKEIYFENSKRLLEEFKKNDFEITYK